MKFGKKYYAAAFVNDKINVFMIDTGADGSCYDPTLLNDAPVEQLSKPINVYGFQADSEPRRVTEAASLTLDFFPGKTKGNFMICPTAGKIPIIGADLLQTNNISLDTSTNILRVDDDVVHVKSSVRAAKKELLRRERLGEAEYKRQNACLNGKERWMRVEKRIVLPPHSVTFVECQIEGARMPENTFSMFSIYDEKETSNEITVASYSFAAPQRTYIIPVENRSTEKLVLFKRFALGEIREISENRLGEKQVFGIDTNYVTLAELRASYEGFEYNGPADEEENSTQSRNSTVRLKPHPKNLKTQNMPKTAKEQDFEHKIDVDQAENEPVLLSELKGNNKPSDELMQKFYKNGVKMDIPIVQNIPSVEIEDTEINIEEEREKSKNCPYWNNREEYLSGFDFSDFKEEEMEYAKNLMYDFRHTFYNTETPQQFQSAIKIEPVQIKLIPGIHPRKDKKRTLSPTKEALLEEHVKRLLAEGVIEELQSVEDCYASNVVVVIEQRYHANVGKTVTKSRVTLDLRSLNLAIPSSSFPLPNMEMFRKELTEENYKYFSNFDATVFYHQIPIANESKRLFGFYAADRVFVMCRLPMGVKSAPSIAQAFIQRAYRQHKNAKPFLDDVTTYSKTRQEMLYEHLPLTLAIASHYGILFKREKTALMKTSCRILGHKIKESSHAGLSNEKQQTILNLPFPTTKKELVSRLAFINWFNHTCPKLSEITAPLRRLVKKHTKFKPTEEDRIAFEKAKEYLLHPQLGALRTPSNDVNHTICIFTDASASSYSSIVTQCLPPTSEEETADSSNEKKMYIVLTWSAVVPETLLNQPIYLKELYALAETFEKYRWFLSFRTVLVCTDSQTIEYWASLGLVSDDVARKLMFIQKFNYKLIYISTKVNPSDTFTRLDDGPKQGIYERFAVNNIYNANGEKIDIDQLFSAEKRAESESYFSTRRQAMSKPVDKVKPITEDHPDDILARQDEHNMEISENQHTTGLPESYATSQKQKILATSTRHVPKSSKGKSDSKIAPLGCFSKNGKNLMGALKRCATSEFDGEYRPKKRTCARKRRRSRRKRTEDSLKLSPPTGTGESGPLTTSQSCKPCITCSPLLSQQNEQHEENDHCECKCARNPELELPAAAISAVEIDDEDFHHGREQIDGDALTSDSAMNVQEPKFDEPSLKDILKMQRKDETIQECKAYLSGKKLPEKHEAVLLPASVQDFLRNFSLFRLTSQDVVTRVWLEPHGEARQLLVVSKEAFQDILKKTHEHSPSNTTENFAHLGMRKTRMVIGKYYFAFKARKQIEDYIRNCAICALNNHHVTHRDPLGDQISPESGNLLVIDHIGPWSGFATTSTGNRRWIFVGVDAASRYAYSCVCSSVSDDETLKCIMEIRHKTSSLYKRYQMDNAICKENSKTKSFLLERGVSVNHGLANNSQSQSKIERFIRTLTRTILKLHTAQPTTNFTDLVAESTLIYNNSPHDSLPRNLSPRDLHFSAPASTFLRPDSASVGGRGVKKSILDALRAARASGMETLRHDVATFLRRQSFRSPTNFTAQLRTGDFVLKKRSSYSTGSGKKLQFRITLEAFEIIGKCATNAFKVINLVNGQISLLSGDVLIRVRGHTKESLIHLVQQMERVAESNEARIEPHATRSRTAREAALSLHDAATGDVKNFLRWTTKESSSSSSSSSCSSSAHD